MPLDISALVSVYLITVNITAFIIYGLDKHFSRRHARRVSEQVLILFAILGGSLGAYFAMWLFRHKTRRPKFNIGVPVIFIVQAALAIFLLTR